MDRNTLAFLRVAAIVAGVFWLFRTLPGWQYLFTFGDFLRLGGLTNFIYDGARNELLWHTAGAISLIFLGIFFKPKRASLEKGLVNKSKELECFTGSKKSLENDAYKIYLVKKYEIEKNTALDKFMCNQKLYSTIEEALAEADSVENSQLPIDNNSINNSVSSHSRVSNSARERAWKNNPSEPSIAFKRIRSLLSLSKNRWLFGVLGVAGIAITIIYLFLDEIYLWKEERSYYGSSYQKVTLTDSIVRDSETVVTQKLGSLLGPLEVFHNRSKGLSWVSHGTKTLFHVGSDWPLSASQIFSSSNKSGDYSTQYYRFSSSMGNICEGPHYILVVRKSGIKVRFIGTCDSWEYVHNHLWLNGINVQYSKPNR